MECAAAAHLPTIYEFAETAEEGGLAAYGPRIGQLVSEVMVQQIVNIFRGAKVADVPVEQPTKFELVITARKLIVRATDFGQPTDLHREPARSRRRFGH